MRTETILLLGLAIVLAGALTRAHSGKMKPSWSQHLKGRQKLLGVIAVVLALLIIITPEFVTLGLVGDSAFFDMLVLALSLQMHMFVARVWHRCVTVTTRCVRLLEIPSLGLRYLPAVCGVAIGSAVSALQRAMH